MFILNALDANARLTPRGVTEKKRAKGGGAMEAPAAADAK
jgi:hypothetical protein